ncbi:MAG TPA: type III secretion system export apparatus subunit SctS [Noviherbaspirillum sp.]|nr:type III secretion system export apparatus subunit SctS [Noviherbaspirillum sp.]
MTPSTIIELCYQALILVVVLSLPAVVTAAVVGLVTGILQAVTQIQDQSIGYAVKLIAVSIAIALTAGWIGAELYQYGENLYRMLPLLGRG